MMMMIKILLIDKDKDGLLPRSEYMEFGCRGVHHTYIHTYIHIHKYTYLHTYILTHKDDDDNDKYCILFCLFLAVPWNIQYYINCTLISVLHLIVGQISIDDQ